MQKAYLVIALLLICMLSLSCIKDIDERDTDSTNFSRMLRYLPEYYLERGEIWFVDFSTGKTVTGIADYPSMEDYRELPEKDKRQISLAYADPTRVVSQIHWWRWLSHPDRELEEFTGLNRSNIDSVIFSSTQFMDELSIIKGQFDSDLMGQKLVSLGYSEATYNSHSYYTIRGDMERDLRDPFGLLVWSQMNRIAVGETTLVFSSVTEELTNVFDALDGKKASVIDHISRRVLVTSLGDVVIGVLIPDPENLINHLNQQPIPSFNFTVPDTWDNLPEYNMIALGSRTEGEDWFFDIALTYSDAESARKAGVEIVNRMHTYEILTAENNPLSMSEPFTNSYLPGEPVINAYDGGAVLKIPCLYIPESRWRPIDMIQGNGYRDLLFLLPDPSPYLANR